MIYTFDLFFLILISGCFYLPTLASSMGYQDTSEFVDTSFALGISHPAGFPAYNLIAKVYTLHSFFTVLTFTWGCEIRFTQISGPFMIWLM